MAMHPNDRRPVDPAHHGEQACFVLVHRWSALWLLELCRELS
ncbi:hypothetical protein NFC81_15435 [Salinispirillum sp. LH 10-3-1]|uniref:Uncharacterized protein n=1 Tax=Salinispirillum sp. LH 10-3-1 TaxID=2952525 RepID=A0AB38YFG2_9GAMM